MSPWQCSCGITNASTNQVCAGIRHYTNVEHNQISPSRYDETLYWAREGRIKELTNNEDKFAQFFNAEAVLISAMTNIELDEHIQELEEIAFEAKARLTSAKSGKRDKDAQTRLGGEWSISPTQPDQTVTDTINKVKLRSARMSKLDKTRQKLEALGLSDKDVDSMINAMLKQAKKNEPDKNPIDIGIVSDELREQRKAEKARLDEIDKASPVEEESKEKAKTEANNQSIPVITAIIPVGVDSEPPISSLSEPSRSKPLDLSKLKFKQ